MITSLYMSDILANIGLHIP